MAASKTEIPQTLKGKVAIVTGASRGLGEGFAYELAKRGAKIVATYTSPKSDQHVTALADKIAALGNGSECIHVRADLRSPDSAAQIVKSSLEAFGHAVDILVNNAGAEVVKPLEDITTDDFDFVYHLNVRAPSCCSRP
uniref:Uncharacterized protein n=1 Tax=Bionectria ochroleuca TaxID=29856 RepID=A0A8H7NM41_BIOOC